MGMRGNDGFAGHVAVIGVVLGACFVGCSGDGQAKTTDRDAGVDDGSAMDAVASRDAHASDGALPDAQGPVDGRVLGDAAWEPDASLCTAGGCDDEDPCTTDTCDPAKGCRYAMLECDDGNECTVDACASATGCMHDPVADGTPCYAGSCSGGTCAVGCASDADCSLGLACTVEQCDIATGDCTQTFNDAVCDDGDACNGVETCTGTFGNGYTGCGPGVPLECDDDNVCTTDSCDPSSGCVHATLADGTQCELPAGKIGTCTGGSCAGCTADEDCDDGFPCTTDQCDTASGLCTNDPVDGACDDGDVCNGAEACDPRVGCVSGTELDCDDYDKCTSDSCDPAMGCQNVEKSCDDGDVCTDDYCSYGWCYHRTADCCVHGHPDCDDRNPCTIDSCDASGDCINAVVPDGTPCTSGDRQLLCRGRSCIGCDDDAQCDDGYYCNGTEFCDPDTGTCQRGPHPDCDDGDPCTNDSCYGSSCRHTVAACSDDDCSDGNECNGIETWDADLSQCVPGIPMEEGAPCTLPGGSQGSCASGWCV